MRKPSSRAGDESINFISKSALAEKLTDALKNHNAEEFVYDLREAVRNEGWAETARRLGIGRETLYRRLTSAKKIPINLIAELFDLFALEIEIKPKKECKNKYE